MDQFLGMEALVGLFMALNSESLRANFNYNYTAKSGAWYHPIYAELAFLDASSSRKWTLYRHQHCCVSY